MQVWPISKLQKMDCVSMECLEKVKNCTETIFSSVWIIFVSLLSIFNILENIFTCLGKITSVSRILTLFLWRWRTTERTSTSASSATVCSAPSTTAQTRCSTSTCPILIQWSSIIGRVKMGVRVTTVTLVASLIREDEDQFQTDQTSSQATHRYPQPLTPLPHLLLHQPTPTPTPQWSNPLPVPPTHLNSHLCSQCQILTQPMVPIWTLTTCLSRQIISFQISPPPMKSPWWTRPICVDFRFIYIWTLYWYMDNGNSTLSTKTQVQFYLW